MLGNNRSSHRYLSYADGIAVAGQDFLLLVARVMVGWIYLHSGVDKVMDPGAFASGMGRRGVPEILGYLAPFIEFFGGLMLVFGIGMRYGTLLLIAFTIAATWIAHTFWSFPEGAQRNQQFIQFWKNVTMTGGLLALFVTGPGRFSLDNWLRRR